jgi:hypothetical protein
MANRQYLLHGVRYAFAEDGWFAYTPESMDDMMVITKALKEMGAIFVTMKDKPDLIFHKRTMFEPMPFPLEQKRVLIDEEEEIHVLEDWLRNVLLKHERGLLPPFKTHVDTNETHSDLACDYSPRRLRWAQRFLHDAYVRGIEDALEGSAPPASPRKRPAPEEEETPAKRIAQSSQETVKPKRNQTGLPSTLPKDILNEMVACYGRYARQEPLPGDGPEEGQMTGPDRLYKYYLASEKLQKYWSGSKRFPQSATFQHRYNKHVARSYESAGTDASPRYESTTTTMAEESQETMPTMTEDSGMTQDSGVTQDYIDILSL